MEDAIKECMVYIRMGALDEYMIRDIAFDFDLEEAELVSALQTLGYM